MVYEQMQEEACMGRHSPTISYYWSQKCL